MTMTFLTRFDLTASEILKSIFPVSSFIFLFPLSLNRCHFSTASQYKETCNFGTSLWHCFLFSFWKAAKSPFRCYSFLFTLALFGNCCIHENDTKWGNIRQRMVLRGWDLKPKSNVFGSCWWGGWRTKNFLLCFCRLFKWIWDGIFQISSKVLCP